MAHAAAPLAFGALGLLLGALHLLAGHATTAKVLIIGVVGALTLAKVATVGYNAVTVIGNALAVARAGAMALLTGRVVVNTAAENAGNASRAAGVGIMLRAAAIWAIQAVRTAAVTAATAAYTAAQWLLNAALTANPIGLVIAAIALLVAGIVVAYKRSETFRNVIHTVWDWLKKFVGFTPLGMLIKNITHAVDWAKKLVGWVKDLIGWIGKIHFPSPPGWMHKGGKLNPLNWGDTSTSRARGSGNLAATMAAHARYSARTGGGVKITNALVGGGGYGRGSGDHQAGRALDLTGRNLHAYARAVRADGGYAAMHGSGATRHLHAVPAQRPMGDTRTSMARRASNPNAGHSARGDVLIAAGAITVDARGMSEGAARRMVAGAISDYVRDREERG